MLTSYIKKQNGRHAFLFFVLLVFVLPVLSGTPALDAQLVDSSERATFSVTSAEKGDAYGETDLKVVIEIQDNWHLQSYETKEGLVATELEVLAPNGAEVANISYPEGHEIDLPPYGRVEVFDGTVNVDATVSVPSSARSGETVKLKLKLTAQACDDDSCLRPGTWTKTVEAPVNWEGSGNTDNTQDDGSTEASDGSDDGGQVTEADDGTDQQSSGESASGSGTTSKGIDFLIPAETPDKPPQEVLDSLWISVDETKTSAFQKKIKNSLFLALIFAFGWGLVSSLSPCVYPMIPLTLSYFGAQGSGEDDEEEDDGEPYARVVGLALVYSLGVSLTFAVLGVIAALIGVELGLALGNPWFVGFLIVLFVALALSMMELFEISMPSSVQGMAGGKPGVAGAFTMGILLGFIAAPCVGPFAAAILAFISASGNVVLGFAGMFSFGLGLSMLFLVLAIFGGYSSALSSGTGWLKNVKIFWGFVLLGITIYFVDLWMGLVGWGAAANWATPLLLGLFGVVFGFWLWNLSGEQESDDGGRLALRAMGKGFALFLLLTGSYYSLAGTIRSEVLIPAPDWLAVKTDFGGKANIESFQKAVEKAEAQKKPIFIDFYADWCIPCKQMDEAVFSDSSVGQFMNDRFVSIKLDATDGAGWNTKLKTEVFQSSSMPFYAFFDAQGNYVPEASFGGKMKKDGFLKQAELALNPEKAKKTSRTPSGSGDTSSDQ